MVFRVGLAMLRYHEKAFLTTDDTSAAIMALSTMPQKTLRCNHLLKARALRRRPASPAHPLPTRTQAPAPSPASVARQPCAGPPRWNRKQRQAGRRAGR